MSLRRYSLLKGYPVALDNSSDDNHVMIQVSAKNQDYCLAVNVQSCCKPLNMRYIVCRHLEPSKHPQLNQWMHLPEGLLPAGKYPQIKLDYIRDSWFQPGEMVLASHYNNPNNQLGQIICQLVVQTEQDPQAMIYAFGQQWGPKKETDRYFGFYPAQGIHDIHMNQGSPDLDGDGWVADNGIYQDGALLFYFPSKKQWIGIFCAFSSQSFHTDKNGNIC